MGDMHAKYLQPNVSLWRCTAAVAAAAVLGAFSGGPAAASYVSDFISVSFNMNGTTTFPDRTMAEATKALDGPGSGTFFALGVGGAAVFDYGVPFSGVKIAETTLFCTVNTDNYCGGFPEQVLVYAFNTAFDFGTDDPVSFLAALTPVATVRNGGAQGADGGATLALGGLFQYLGVMDASAGLPYSPDVDLTTLDGFDLDYLAVQPVSAPGGAVLLCFGLAAVWASRRRRS